MTRKRIHLLTDLSGDGAVRENTINDAINSLERQGKEVTAVYPTASRYGEIIEVLIVYVESSFVTAEMPKEM